jgi:hypothetical protein
MDKWNTKNMKQESFIRSVRSIPSDEQEVVFQKGRNDNHYYVNCSDQLVITKLKRNPNFVVAKAYTSTTGMILQVEGLLPVSCMGLRGYSRIA